MMETNVKNNCKNVSLENALSKVIGNNKKVIVTWQNLYPHQIISSAHCQREFKPEWAKWIAEHWSDALENAVVVSKRDGKYYSCDGQHTTAAHKMVKPANATIHCKVITGLTEQEEAQLFDEINSNRKPLTAKDSLNSQVRYKPEIMEMIRICEKYGIIVDYNKEQSKRKDGKFHTKAVKTLESVYNRYGKKRFERICSIISKGFMDEPKAFCAEIIDGVSAFVNIYDTDINDKVFIKRLNSTTPKKLISDAKDDRASGNVKTYMKVARLLRATYNTDNPRGKIENRFDF